jgi:spore germination cell wall hydrolase CwlJ-like protein
MLIAHEGPRSRFVPLSSLLHEFALAWPGAALPMASSVPVANDAVDTLARTLWGEARGEPLNGIRAVAAVVMNRVEHPRIRWWGTGVVGVCRAGKQFSCWNGDDPNLPKLLAVDGSNDRFRLCVDVAREAVSGLLPSRVRGATHYHHKRILPGWAQGKVPCEDIRNHLFYNDIER